MALLQISEPGMSTAPHQHRLAVGIDPGHHQLAGGDCAQQHSRSAERRRRPPLLPSVVRYLPNGHANIGYKAQAAQTTDPKNTIVSVKRFMGRGLADIAYAENLPYDFLDAPGMVQLKTVAGVKSPVEVSAQILATLRQRAEDSLGDDLVGAVITVPAYFDDAQRQATKDAAQLAGLNVLRLQRADGGRHRLWPR
jgi:molecular chaperone HscA